MDTSGAGITVVIFGKNTISARPPMISGYTGPRDVVHLGDLGHEDQDGERVDEADHHERGTNRISFATPSAPRTIWKTPARMTAATR